MLFRFNCFAFFCHPVCWSRTWCRHVTGRYYCLLDVWYINSFQNAIFSGRILNLTVKFRLSSKYSPRLAVYRGQVASRTVDSLGFLQFIWKDKVWFKSRTSALCRLAAITNVVMTLCANYFQLPSVDQLLKAQLLENLCDLTTRVWYALKRIYNCISWLRVTENLDNVNEQETTEQIYNSTIFVKLRRTKNRVAIPSFPN